MFSLWTSLMRSYIYMFDVDKYMSVFQHENLTVLPAKSDSDVMFCL